MVDEDSVLINEHDIGTCNMVDDFEASYLKSCEHNKTTPDDLEYFRRYVWNLLAMIVQMKQS